MHNTWIPNRNIASDNRISGKCNKKREGGRKKTWRTERAEDVRAKFKSTFPFARFNAHAWLRKRHWGIEAYTDVTARVHALTASINFFIRTLGGPLDIHMRMYIVCKVLICFRLKSTKKTKKNTSKEHDRNPSFSLSVRAIFLDLSPPVGQNLC